MGLQRINSNFANRVPAVAGQRVGFESRLEVLDRKNLYVLAGQIDAKTTAVVNA